MSNQKKMVPFTNKLGVTMMIMETEVTVEEGEDTVPIDHMRWIFAIGALASVALQLTLPFMFAR